MWINWKGLGRKLKKDCQKPSNRITDFYLRFKRSHRIDLTGPSLQKRLSTLESEQGVFLNATQNLEIKTTNI